jgi:curved DNA-binding protein CbpA
LGEASLQNHYAVLGLRDDADEVVIAAAFRSLSKKYRPDTSGSVNKSDVEKFRKITEAYEVLRDPGKRKRFDEHLSKARERSSKVKTGETKSSSQKQSDSKKKFGKADDAKNTGQASKSTSPQPKSQEPKSKSQRWVWGSAIAGGLGALLLIGYSIKLAPEHSDGTNRVGEPEPIAGTPAIAPKIAAVASGNKGDLDIIYVAQDNPDKIVTERFPSELKPETRDAIVGKPTVAPQIEAVTSENKGNLLEASRDTSSKVITDRLPTEPLTEAEVHDLIVANASEMGDPTQIAEQGSRNALSAKSLNASLADAEDPNKYRSAANSGDVGAMVALGLIARDGMGMKRDYSEAFKMFKLASDKGNTDAAYWLATMYNNGQGVGIDFTQAIRLYAMAALRGHKAAATRLRAGTGLALSSGIDVNGKTYSQALDEFHQSVGGKEVNDELNSLASVATDASAATPNSNQVKLAASSTSNDAVTGGGGVQFIKADAFERRSEGKLEGCEIAFKLAYIDGINRQNGITVLDGAVSILLAGQGREANLRVALKVSAADVVGDTMQVAPLKYAYISKDRQSYAGEEIGSRASEDGGVLEVFNAIRQPELVSAIASGFELGITRKDSTTDIVLPVNFSRNAADKAEKQANCTSMLLDQFQNELKK